MSDTATSGVKQSFQLKSANVSLTALELYYFDNEEFLSFVYTYNIL